MNPSETKSTIPYQPKRWRILRRCLVGLGACLTLICIFYTEERWRGKRALENCKRALEAQGVDFNWASYIPAPVPDDQNVFGVPEMQRWFTGRGARDLSPKLDYPDIRVAIGSKRMVIAELTIGLLGTPAPDGSVMLRWDDPASRSEAAKLLTNAVGPTTMAPQSVFGLGIMLRQPKEIQVAQIFLQCRTAPAEKELEQLLPDSIFNVRTDAPNRAIQFEPNGVGSYHVTIPALTVASDYLTWSDQLEPEFALIREALKRPSARMAGDYTSPELIPIPNFVLVRSFAQTLSARAQCCFLLGRPAEALRDLTLLHDLCRPVMEMNKPMTLVSAMINAAVRGLYVNIIDDGLRFHVWREPQLTALEEQLKQVNLLPTMKQACEAERLFGEYSLAKLTPAQFWQLYGVDTVSKTNSWMRSAKNRLIGEAIPRGWFYQNAATGINLYSNVMAGLDPVNQTIFPDKIETFGREFDALMAHRSPYVFLVPHVFPNYKRAIPVVARDQTMINQALIACALERYHLAHGEYPETLAALTPQLLDKIPRDVIGGQPPHYRRAADGTFTLYSIGWTGRDNNGVRGKSIPEGDWVWPEQ